jgi:hypothetical protein
MPTINKIADVALYSAVLLSIGAIGISGIVSIRRLAKATKALEESSESLRISARRMDELLKDGGGVYFTNAQITPRKAPVPRMGAL